MNLVQRFLPLRHPSARGVDRTGAPRAAARGMVPTPRNPDMTIYEPHVEQGGRTIVLRTDDRLQVGPEPAHIDRIKRAMNTGYVGPRGEAGFGRLAASFTYIGHVPLVHRVTGPAPSYAANNYDDHAYIPAVMVGNPVESPQ